MQCKKCGAILSENDEFCKMCGEKLNQVNLQNNENFKENMQKKSEEGGKANVGLAILSFIIPLVGLILFCVSKEGKKAKKTYGICALVSFVISTILTIAISVLIFISMSNVLPDAIEEISNSSSINEYNNYNNENNKSDTITVGDDSYGYINIPNNWGKFYDSEGNDSLQYSYGNVYIVSLNYFKNNKYSAEECAKNYMYSKKNSSDVTDVTGATVKIGKSKEYTAYQVYMYYPGEAKYLITYWFDTEGGDVHYIALEGPGDLNGIKLSDYLYIPESFSLKK